VAVPAPDWLFRNWPIKLTALVLSAVLWAVVAAEEPTTEIIPVELEVALPAGRALSRPIGRVQALYSGSARELFKLYGQPPRIVKSIPDTVSGFAFTLELSVADLITRPDADVNAVEVQPELIRIVLDDAVEQNVPVTLRAAVTADSGYAIVEAPRVVPDSVTVRGPSVHVQSVRSLPTEATDLRGLRSSIRRTVRVDTTGLGVVRIVPTEVDIVVNVAELATRLIIGVPMEVRSDRGGAWVTDPPAVAVMVQGVAARLRTLTRDSLQATVSISGATDEEFAAVTLRPPAGLTATPTPDSVTVRRTGG
jgi:hypothetical protein